MNYHTTEHPFVDKCETKRHEQNAIQQNVVLTNSSSCLTLYPVLKGCFGRIAIVSSLDYDISMLCSVCVTQALKQSTTVFFK